MTNRVPPAHRRLAAVAIGCSILLGAAIVPVLASSRPSTVAGPDWSSFARLRHLQAETVGADTDEIADLDTLIDPDGDLGETADEVEAPEPTETPDAAEVPETPDPTEKAEPTHAPRPAVTAKDEDGDEDGDHESADDDGDHVDANHQDSGSHETGDAGEHDDGESGGD